MHEHDTVVLTRSLPDHGLEPGDVGTIVHVYESGNDFEVEFVGGSGQTIAAASLMAKNIRPVATSEIFHVRGIPA